MRSPNLNLSTIAATLAALGTSAVLSVACGGGAAEPSKSPAGMTETTATPGAKGQGSCSANGSCGAKTGATDTKPDMTTPTTGAAGGSGGTATPTPTTTPTTTTAANATPAPTTTTTATPTTATPKPPMSKPKAGGTKGQASCGAGTCSADPKKK